MRNSGVLVAVLILMLITGGIGAWFLLFKTDAPTTPSDDGSAGTQARLDRNSANDRQAPDVGSRAGDQVVAPQDPQEDETPAPAPRPTTEPADQDQPSNPTAPTRPQPVPGETTPDQAAAEPSPEDEEYAELDQVEPLPPVAGVWGRVAGPDGQPVAGVELHLMLLRPSGYVPAAFARTEADGMFAIGAPELLAGLEDFNRASTGFTPRPIQPGAYRIEARAMGREMRATDVELRTALVRQDIRLQDERTVTLTLRCFNTNGIVASQPQVTVLHRDGGDGGAHSSRFSGAGRGDPRTSAPMRTGESLITVPATPLRGQPGVFTLQVKAMRSVELTVTQTGYRCLEPVGGKFQLDLSDANHLSLELRFEQLPPGIMNETVNRASGRYGDQAPFIGDATISGSVSLGFPARLSTVSIELRRAGMEPRQIRVDSTTGEFEFAGVANGLYDLVLSSADFQSFPTRSIEVKSQREFVDWVVGRSGLSINLSSENKDYIGSILTVTSPALHVGTPLRYMVVEHVGPINTPPTTEGEYWADLLGESSVLADGEADGRVYFNVTGESSQTIVNMAVAVPGSVSWRVLDGQGYGWAGAEVRVVRSERMESRIRPARNRNEAIDWDRTRLVPVDNLGNGQVERIAPGEYVALVWTRSTDPDRWDREVRFVVTAGQATNLGTIGSK